MTRLFDVAEREGFRSLRKLATALGVSHSQLSRIRRGERGAGFRLRQRAKRYFRQYDGHYLFPDEDLRTTAPSEPTAAGA